MRRHRHTKCFWLGVLICTLTQPAWADFFIHRFENFSLPRRTLRLAPELSFFLTQSNYNANGTSETPAGFQRYSRLTSDISAAVGASHFLSFYGRFSWIKNDLTTTTGGGGNIFGPGDQSVGMGIRLLQPRPGTRKKKHIPILDLQIQTDFPVYSNSNPSLPFAGEGSTDITLGAFLDIPVTQHLQYLEGEWKLLLGAGYTLRSEEFSTLFHWLITIKHVFENSQQYTFGLSLFGVQAQNPLEMTNAGNGAGGSFIVNSTSPSYFGTRLQVAYEWEENRSLYFNLNPIFSGTNSPSGFSANLGFELKWAPKKITDDSQDHHPSGAQSNTLPDLPELAPAAPSPPSHKLSKPKKTFITHDFEGRVIKMSDRLNLLKINKGSQDGVEVGQIFDIFISISSKNGVIDEAVARAECISVQPSQAVLKITEYYQEVWIEEGFLVKRPIP